MSGRRRAGAKGVALGRCMRLAVSVAAGLAAATASQPLSAGARPLSGQQSEIVFYCDSEICALDGDGTHRRVLVSGLAKGYNPLHARYTADDPAGQLTNVAISRDGRELAWFSEHGRIWIASSDGSHVRPVPGVKLRRDCLGLLAWNPDDARVAYSSLCAHTIYEVGVDGSGRRSLVVLGRDSDGSAGFSFSPDGTKLALSAISCVHKARWAHSIFIATLQPDAPVILHPTAVPTGGAAGWHRVYLGPHLRRLTAPGSYCHEDVATPGWSSQGAVFFLVERWFGSLTSSKSHIVMADMHAHPIAFHRVGPLLAPLTNGLSVSPQGDKVVVSAGGGTPQLALIDLDGHIRYLPYTHYRDDEWPSWGS